MADMTDPEAVVMSHLVGAWNAFVALPTKHSDEQSEFRSGIHALQNMIMSRPTRRNINGNSDGR